MFKARRGFEIVAAFKDKAINLPRKGTPKSAGYDIEAANDLLIQPKAFGLVETGLKAYMGRKEVLQIYPRSSLAKTKDLVLINSVGIIDADYYNNPDNEGHIRILLYNIGNKPAKVQKGERLVQGIFVRHLDASKGKTHSDKRQGGLGSTGI